MSVLSQFFGGGDKIRLDALVVAGGGGGGLAAYPSYNIGGGGGGAGGVFYGHIDVGRGETCPITVGGGGVAPASLATASGNGGNSSISNTYRTITTLGGGGGYWGNPAVFPYATGVGSGGSGGGGAWLANVTPVGASLHRNRTSDIPGVNVSQLTNNYPEQPSFYGTPGLINPNGGPGNGQGGSAVFSNNGPGSLGIAFMSYIEGTLNGYGYGGIGQISSPAPTVGTNTGNGGHGSHPGGVPATNGAPGVVIVRYPTQYAAATINPGAAATDLTPTTSPLGFRTYKFISPGSITLP